MSNPHNNVVRGHAVSLCALSHASRRTGRVHPVPFSTTCTTQHPPLPSSHHLNTHTDPRLSLPESNPLPFRSEKARRGLANGVRLCRQVAGNAGSNHVCYADDDVAMSRVFPTTPPSPTPSLPHTSRRPQRSRIIPFRNPAPNQHAKRHLHM